MKNKTKTYVLLVVVLSIWGVIGYQIMTTLNPEDLDVVQQDFAVNFNPKTNTVIDTFSVQTVERDPFLGTLTLQHTSKSKPKLNTKRKKINWMPIRYLGLIKKLGSSQKVFVLNINGKQHLLKQGQHADSITLIRGNTKAIVVGYKNQQKTFTIQQ